jgi:hypothetical protein
MSDEHSAIGNVQNFVSEPDDKYRDNCAKPNWTGKKKGGKKSDAAFAFAGEKTSKEDGTVKYYKVAHEAHHILSVSCVDNLVGLPEPQKNVVRLCCHETDWNINNANNLIPLPLFGHTLKWYVIDENSDAPDWANFPQHDWDHNSKNGYCADVRDDILKFYKTLKVQVQGHAVTAKGIQDDLIAKENKWRKQIKARGEGTHDAWKNMEVQAKWYEPFSMAAEGSASYRPPLRIENKIKRLKELLKHFGEAN